MNRILLSALAVAAGAGTMCAENLFTGNQEVTWENTLSIEAEKFASAAVGDELVVTIAEGATDVMELKADGQWLPGTILTRLDGKTEVKAYLTDGMQAALKKYGLELCGPSFTVQSSTLMIPTWRYLTVRCGQVSIGLTAAGTLSNSTKQRSLAKIPKSSSSIFLMKLKARHLCLM